MTTPKARRLLYAATVVCLAIALPPAITVIAVAHSPASVQEPQPRDAFQAKVAPLLELRTEEIAADPAEPVDADPGLGHCLVRLSSWFPVECNHARRATNP